MSKSLPDPKDAPTEWIPLGSIRTDERVNRPCEAARVKRISENYDPSLVNVIVVAASGKRYVVLDGQHRTAAMRELFGDDHLVEAKVYKGLTVPQMATMFVGLNDAKNPHPIQLFTKRATGGDPVAVAITKIVESHGLEISQPADDGHVVAVAAMERIYLGFGRNGATPDLLGETLDVAINAWGRTSHAVRAEILSGLALVLLRDGSLIDKPVLIKKLSLVHAGASGVGADARQLRDLRGGTLQNSVADVVVSTYNRGRRTRKLPDWRTA